jgi:hypothetical protein
MCRSKYREELDKLIYMDSIYFDRYSMTVEDYFVNRSYTLKQRNPVKEINVHQKYDDNVNTSRPLNEHDRTIEIADNHLKLQNNIYHNHDKVMFRNNDDVKSDKMKENDSERLGSSNNIQPSSSKLNEKLLSHTSLKREEIRESEDILNKSKHDEMENINDGNDKVNEGSHKSGEPEKEITRDKETPEGDVNNENHNVKDMRLDQDGNDKQKVKSNSNLSKHIESKQPSQTNLLAHEEEDHHPSNKKVSDHSLKSKHSNPTETGENNPTNENVVINNHFVNTENQNSQSEGKPQKHDEITLNDYELLNAEEAITHDQRSFCKFYTDEVTKHNTIVSLISKISIFDPPCMRVFKFFILCHMLYGFNAIVHTDDYIDLLFTHQTVNLTLI